MKLHNSEQIDELRAEYRRSDFGQMIRGKYAASNSPESVTAKQKKVLFSCAVQPNQGHAQAV
jgi:hypothetical protein